MTLEQIRAALPTHIMLTPGTKLNRETDEYMDVVGGDKDFYSLMGVEDLEQDTVCGTEGLFFRRPIPPHILDNQAFYLLLDKGFESRDHFADKAENLGIVRKLGGLDNYRAQTKAGRLYDKWLLEQIESGG